MSEPTVQMMANAGITTASSNLRPAPGSAWCLASGILALLFCWMPLFAVILGISSLLNSWRAHRHARKQPDRYLASGVPLAGRVLTLISWFIAALIWLVTSAIITAASAGDGMLSPVPAAERW